MHLAIQELGSWLEFALVAQIIITAVASITAISMEYPSVKKWGKYNLFFIMDMMVRHRSYISTNVDEGEIKRLSQYLRLNGVDLSKSNTDALEALVARGDLAIVVKDREFRHLEAA
jgi:hypothetical protein